MTADSEEGPVYYDENRHAIRRAYDELVGLCRGILFDGRVSDEEVVRIHAWLNTYPDAWREWPGDVIANRVRQVLSDGVVDEEERLDLKEELTRLTGQRTDEYDVPTELPLTQPPPTVLFKGNTFCLTGSFLFGKRSHCEHAIKSLGGLTLGHVNSKVRYVVIGTRAARAWIHSTHGTKIEAAMGYLHSGHEISIVSEQHWTRFLLPALAALPS